MRASPLAKKPRIGKLLVCLCCPIVCGGYGPHSEHAKRGGKIVAMPTLREDTHKL